MNIIRIFTPAALVVALSLVPLPAAAQGNRRGDRGREAQEAGRGPRDAGRYSAGRAVPREYGYRGPAARDNGRQREMAPRQYYRYQAPRDLHRGYGYAPPRVYRPSYRSYYRPVVPYRPHFFGRPYYAFRPRLDLGFGLWIGFGVPYPHAWVTSYPPPVYGYYDGGIGVVPGARVYGGVSFDIGQADAVVYLDGAYIGYARDFAPNAVPLTIVPGPHEIVVQAEGFRPVSWQVHIAAGQVIPFRGGLRPY